MTTLMFVAVSVVLTCSQVACGQKLSPVDKVRAMKEVRVSSLPGWHEAVSREGRFRILFPGEPQLYDDVMSMGGFKFIEPESHWFAYYRDFDQLKSNNEYDLRIAYRNSVESITRSGKRLVSQEDVLLNGRLGTDFVIEAPGRRSYLRAFLFDGRMYTLAVDRKEVGTGNASTPIAVQQFFDSFAYWDQ